VAEPTLVGTLAWREYLRTRRSAPPAGRPDRLVPEGRREL